MKRFIEALLVGAAIVVIGDSAKEIVATISLVGLALGMEFAT